MRYWALVLCIVVIGVVGYVNPLFVAEAQNSTNQPYVVQYGDTLWDIAGTHLNNPYRWREIHQNNPFITNPNLIYPGDVIGLGPGVSVPGGLEEGRKKLSDKKLARPWYGVPAPEPKEVKLTPRRYPINASTEFFEAIGYIVPYSIYELESADFGQITGVEYGEKEASPKVIDSESGRPGLIYGDIIYIDKGTVHEVREGDVFVAFRPAREIRHPLTSELMGTYIHILGRIRIKTLEEGISCAEIVKSYSYVEIGDAIMPMSELSLPLKKPLLGNSRSYGFKVGNQLIAHIMAERVGRMLIGDGDIVFLDVGAAQGIQPADNFIVFREIGKGYPKQSIGRVTVLNVQEQTSTALIIESVKSFNRGEKIVLMR